MNSKRAKELRRNPRSITLQELEELLELRHEVQNLRTQVTSLQRTVTQHQSLYHNSNAESVAKNGQIQSLGRVLDSERKLIPAEARKTLVKKSKPGKGQDHGFGAYVSPIAPTAENM